MKKTEKSVNHDPNADDLHHRLAVAAEGEEVVEPAPAKAGPTKGRVSTARPVVATVRRKLPPEAVEALRRDSEEREEDTERSVWERLLDEAVEGLVKALFARGRKLLRERREKEIQEEEQAAQERLRVLREERAKLVSEP